MPVFFFSFPCFLVWSIFPFFQRPRPSQVLPFTSPVLNRLLLKFAPTNHPPIPLPQSSSSFSSWNFLFSISSCGFPSRAPPSFFFVYAFLVLWSTVLLCDFFLFFFLSFICFWSMSAVFSLLRKLVVSGSFADFF